ncbi:DASH complex subunit DAM1 [Metschnikowia aff. pulcherrima]|uniref:DASH complex subunit DAM1 n=1 Tax=Metschnikowia aff. pulcherrima TaxID=2163413 RepID=A0A4P6XUK4_9ASCO|nr:DASH complex subunit DAM1 [Metschnikowia aff. pulcherrima]
MSSRPQTPSARLRDSRRKLLRSSGLFRAIGPIEPSPKKHYPREILPLESPEFKIRFEAMGEAFGALNKNTHGLSLMHNAVTDFNESFASFLYGLLLTMFCNNFPGCPTREQYEAMEEQQHSEERVGELERRLAAAKLRNAKLRAEIAHRAPETRPRLHLNELFSQRPAARQRPPVPLAFTPSQAQKRVTVARDDSYSTTDTFIEAPGATRGVLSSAANAQSGTGTAGSAHPNLNQPPRYMRGLFEILGASNTRRAGRQKLVQKGVDKPTQRIQGRALLGQTERSSSAQRRAMYSANVAARNPVSAAAQRAQRARENRLAARPPFR